MTIVSSLATAMISSAAILWTGAGNPPAYQIQPTPSFHIAGEQVVLPFVLVDEYPFIEAEVNGAHGKLMFDTGANGALALNSRTVPLPPGEVIGTGMFGSGQTYTKVRHARVGPIRIGPLTFDTATDVQSQDAAQLERITPDFIGWIGYRFFDGYAVKLDYDALQATFYKDGRGAADRYLEGETVAAVIPFETRLLPNIPIVPARLGLAPVEVAFDTGQYGTIFVTPDIQAALESEGRLRPVDVPGETRADLTQLVFGDDDATLDLRVDLADAPFPAAGPIGLQAPTVITLGYTVLSRYKTVWDYAAKTLYLLERTDPASIPAPYPAQPATRP